ncbi:MAG: 30S ribosomal protein S10 [Wolbachia endosymbiont of Ctenocephalides felis wCfeF]|nr:MAG: 30S ribosomal protein S10 [Wolbachia endosymbiont of Ctenocephalides felis wCfeF]
MTTKIEQEGMHVSVEVHINIYAFDCSKLEKYIREFVREFKDKLKHSSAKLSGPVALPRRKPRFDFNRSPHVDKKSREQFEQRTSKRLIVLYNPTPAIMQMLGSLPSPSSFPLLGNTPFPSPPPGIEVDSKIKKLRREG